ncbi:MAG: TCP-1/cpn60 chaperonin family protein [Nitrososphaerota archaeon]
MSSDDRNAHERPSPLLHEAIPRPSEYIHGQPVYIIRKGSTESIGKPALKENIAAAKALASMFKSLLGPNRMQKLLIVQEGRSELIFQTSDMRTILKKIKLEHPIAQFLAGAAIAASTETGSGAVSTLLLASQILVECESLIDKGLHQNDIVDGLTLAYKFVQNALDELSFRLNYSTIETINKCINCEIRGKVPYHDEHIASLLNKVINTIGLEPLKNPDTELHIDVKKIVGGGINDSFVVNGIALFREPFHPRMPRRVVGAKIAVIKGELRIPNKKISRYQDYSFEFDDPNYWTNFEEKRREFLDLISRSIFEVGANVVAVEKGVDELLIEKFADQNIMLIMRFPPPEFDRFVKIVGAVPVVNTDQLEPSYLGYAEIVEYEKINNEYWVFFKGCKNLHNIDIVLRGANKYIIDDVERIINNVIRLARSVARDDRVVWGGGAIEEEISLLLQKYAEEIPDKKQLVIEAVARAFEIIPYVLIESIGMDPIDGLSRLRREHVSGNKSFGVDVINASLGDVSKHHILDPLPVKKQIINSAFEAAYTIMRIDHLVRCRQLSEPEKYYVERVKKTSIEELKKKKEDIVR